MTADLVKRVNLDLLYPEFLEKLLELLFNCRLRGADYFVVEGHRDMIRSDLLYKAFLNGGARAAPAGASQHNFGLAVDLCRDIDLKKAGLQPSWNSKDYDILAEECKKLGLHHGRGYKDDPHVGWPTHITAKQLLPLLRIYNQHKHLPTELERLKPVWASLDLKGSTP